MVGTPYYDAGRGLYYNGYATYREDTGGNGAVVGIIIGVVFLAICCFLCCHVASRHNNGVFEDRVYDVVEETTTTTTHHYHEDKPNAMVY